MVLTRAAGIFTISAVRSRFLSTASGTSDLIRLAKSVYQKPRMVSVGAGIRRGESLMFFLRMTAVGALASLVIWSVVSAQTGEPRRPLDPHGKMDTVRIAIEPESHNRWQAVVYLTNDENLAAMTLPFRWGPGHGVYRIDSASYVNTRTSGFAVKTFYPDTLRETILIGLISDLGRGLPPLDPGSGPIARLFFSGVKPGARPLTLDTTFLPPHNVLQLVTPDVASVYPIFKFEAITGPGR
jgi:hypothetical protein